MLDPSILDPVQPPTGAGDDGTYTAIARFIKSPAPSPWATITEGRTNRIGAARGSFALSDQIFEPGTGSHAADTGIMRRVRPVLFSIERVWSMKFAAYTEETIWSVAETEAEARSEGEETIRESNGTAEQLAALKVAPIDDDLVEALTEAEASGVDVLFDLIDGELCEVETIES